MQTTDAQDAQCATANGAEAGTIRGVEKGADIVNWKRRSQNQRLPSNRGGIHGGHERTSTRQTWSQSKECGTDHTHSNDAIDVAEAKRQPADNLPDM